MEEIFKNWPEVEAIERFVEDLKSRYPHKIKIEKYGFSVERRTLFAVRVCLNASATNLKRFLLTGYVNSV